jgi:hypothetical protein
MEAIFENRNYNFNKISIAPSEVKIEMYHTPYTFVKNEKGWENHSSNRFNMAPGLILAVIAAVGIH